jgi:hypothetical protein
MKALRTKSKRRVEVEVKVETETSVPPPSYRGPATAALPPAWFFRETSREEFLKASTESDVASQRDTGESKVSPTESQAIPAESEASLREPNVSPSEPGSLPLNGVHFNSMAVRECAHVVGGIGLSPRRAFQFIAIFLRRAALFFRANVHLDRLVIN